MFLQKRVGYFYDPAAAVADEMFVMPVPDDDHRVFLHSRVDLFGRDIEHCIRHSKISKVGLNIVLKGFKAGAVGVARCSKSESSFRAKPGR